MKEQEKKQSSALRDRASSVIREQRAQFGRKLSSPLQKMTEAIHLNESSDNVEVDVEVDVIINGRFTGNIKTTGNVSVYGHFEGDIHCHNIEVYRTAHIIGDVFHVIGNDTSKATIEGQVTGSVFMRQVLVRNGGLINGSVTAEGMICTDSGSRIANGKYILASFAKVTNNGIIDGKIRIDGDIIKEFV